MRITYGHSIRNERDVQDFSGHVIRIGSALDNELVLTHSSIAPLHVVLHQKNGTWECHVVGPIPIQLNDHRLLKGSKLHVTTGDTMLLQPFSLLLELSESVVDSANDVRKKLDHELNQLIYDLHLKLLERMNLASRLTNNFEEGESYHVEFEHNVEDLLVEMKVFNQERRLLANHTAALAVRRAGMEQLLSEASEKAILQEKKSFRNRLLTSIPEREKELQITVNKLLSVIKVAEISDLSEQMTLYEKDFWQIWEQFSKGIFSDFVEYLSMRHLKKELKDIVFGFGPLEDLLRLPAVSEIMVVDRERIYIEKNGVVENSGRQFISDDVTVAIIERIVSQVGRRIDKSSPLVDARLPDGSRVNAVISPIAVSGPCLTIRKFPARKLTVNDLIKKGALTRSAAEFLRASVLARKNIIVSGGTGTGKTTLLNCLSDYIPTKERIVTIEDTAELQLKKPHVVRMEAKVANVEGAGAYTIRDLVKNSLRMRPDRIVVGECRGPEALDMLQAMNTGHDGSMTTLHANNANDAMLRLEVLVQMAANLPVSSIHRQICSAVDLVVQLHRLRDGRRVVSQITQVVGIDKEQGGILTRDLFVLEGEDADAHMMATGSLPTFMEELLVTGAIKLEDFYL